MIEQQDVLAKIMTVRNSNKIELALNPSANN